MAGTYLRLPNRVATLDDPNDLNSPIAVVVQCTADGTGALPTDVAIEGVAGMLVGVDVEFDDTTTPDQVDASILSWGSIEVLSGSDTSSYRIPAYDAVPMIGLRASLLGNTAASAVCNLVFYLV